MALHEDDVSIAPDLGEEAALTAGPVETPKLSEAGPEAFFRITLLAEAMFEAKAAIVLSSDRGPWFKARANRAEPTTPCGEALRQAVVSRGAVLVLPDTRRDPRFAADPAVLEKDGVRFFAGAPLRTPEGQSVGALYIYGPEPREFSPREVNMLLGLADILSDQIELRAAASFDPLTGAFSRRVFQEQAERAMRLASRHDHEIAVVAIDLDQLGRVNANHGHAIGDVALSRVVAACMRQLRTSDFIGRTGGDDFAVVLPYASAADAAEVAERMRVAVEAEVYRCGADTFAVTACFGVASQRRSGHDFKALMSEAEAATHLAKLQGRNRCVLARPVEGVGDRPDERRRVFKAGRILFNRRGNSVACTVRSMSDRGAGLDIDASAVLPETFELAIDADETTRNCRIVGFADRHIEIEFD